MCVLLILKDRLDGYPWVVAANRDESYDRPSISPGPVRGPLRFFSGVDRKAGGTWLGLNEKGLVSVITNRPGGEDNRDRPSRGRVSVAVLLQPDTGAALSFLRDLESDVTPWKITAAAGDQDLHVDEAPISGPVGTGYNPFNLFAAQGDQGFVAYQDGSLQSEELGPGLHVLTNDHDLDRLPIDEIRERIGRERIYRSSEMGELIATLKDLLAHHEGVGPERYPICKHGERYGTVSSTIIAVGREFPRDLHYTHAEGSPCKNPYHDYSQTVTRAFS